MGLERLTKTDPLELGRFKILARLGAGGMGVVYLAEDLEGRPVAVKVVKAEFAADPTFRSRFRREVEAGRRVSGVCAARYLDADPRAREPWLATEYVPGPTLHSEIHDHGPVSGDRLYSLAAALADALVSIHGAGLVHRDFKPANVILAPDVPKVIDFGVALPSNATALTSTGSLVGSPAYMSPEQAQGLTDTTPAADIFSWASTVTYAGRGVPPFGEGDAAGVLYRVVHDQADLTNVDPTMVPYLDAALEKDPENRPTSLELAGGLSSLLNGAAAGAAPAATAVMAAWQPAWGGDMHDASMTLAAAREMREELPPRDARVRYQERRKANRKILVIALASALALAAIGYFALIRGDGKDTQLTQAGGNQPGGESSSTVAGETTTLPPGETTTVPGGAAAGGGDTTVAPGGATTVAPANGAPGASVGPTVATKPPNTLPSQTTVAPGPSPACPLRVVPSSGSFKFGESYTVSMSTPVTEPIRIRAARLVSNGTFNFVWFLDMPESGARPIGLSNGNPKTGEGGTAENFTDPAPLLHKEFANRLVRIDVVRRSDLQRLPNCETPFEFTTPAS